MRPDPAPPPTPTIVWATAGLAGAGAGWQVAGQLAMPLAAGLGLVSLGGTMVVAGVAARRRTGRARRWWRPAVVATAVLVTFAGLGVGHHALLHGGVVDRLAREGGSALVVARVASEPAVVEAGRWWTILRVRTLDGTPSRERVLLRGDETPPVLGATLVFRATARPVGTEGFDGYLRRRHVVALVAPTGPVAVRAGPGRLLASTEHVRARVRQAATLGLEGDRAGLAVGLVTGDTRLLSAAAEERMAEVGLTHLVAVSGSNVAVAIAGLGLLAGVVGLGARGRRVLLVMGVGWFVVLTRAEPSVLRAATMAGMVLLARARGVGSSAVHALGVAVLALLVVDPALAGQLGLLLSAGATAGVLLVAPAVRWRLDRWPTRVADLLAITIGAQVAVAPILLLGVGEVPLTSVPANLVAVPAAACASAVGVAASAVAVASPMVAAPLFAVADLPLRVVLAASRLPDLPVVHLADPVTLLLAAGATVWLVARPRTRASRVGATAALLAAVLLVPIARPASGPLTVTAIDVGQGDAVLVEGGGARILVDGGPDEDVTADWLRRRRVRFLDLVVLSHPHADHAAGLPAVVEAVDVGAVWLRDVDDTVAVADVREAAARAGVPVHEPVAGQRAAVGDLLVHVLSPPRGRPFRGERELNDMSLVLRVDQGGRRALLTGDVEAAAQAHLLATPSALRAGLLKVPHHGSATTDPAFLDAVAPQVAMVSAGRDNDYGHPHDELVTALDRLGAQVRRTDLEGTVAVSVPSLDPPTHGFGGHVGL